MFGRSDLVPRGLFISYTEELHVLLLLLGPARGSLPKVCYVDVVSTVGPTLSLDPVQTSDSFNLRSVESRRGLVAV